MNEDPVGAKGHLKRPDWTATLELWPVTANDCANTLIWNATLDHQDCLIQEARTRFAQSTKHECGFQSMQVSELIIFCDNNFKYCTLS